MKFYGTKNTLQELENRDEIYVEEMAGLFLDLCRDVREDTGVLAAKLPVADAEAAALLLCQMGQMYLAILKDQADVLMETEKVEMLRQIEQKIQDRNQQIKEASEAVLNLEQKKQELSQKERELSGKKEQKEQLKRECEKLKGEIEDQGEIDLAAWKEEKKRLEGENEEKKGQIETIRAQEEELKRQGKQLREELDEKTRQVEQKKKEVGDLKKKCELREKEKEQLCQREKELEEKLGEIDFQKENERIEEAQRYADVMLGAWNAASEQLVIYKKIDNLEELEKEMSGKRRRIEEALEVYRTRMEYVIQSLEEGEEE